MTAKTYLQKLKDPRWQKLRLQVMERAEFACENCGDTDSTLNVHHRAYFKGHEPWDYDICQLSCLCESCHEVISNSDDPLKWISSFVGYGMPDDRYAATFLLAGFIGIDVSNVCCFLSIDSLPYMKKVHKIGCDARDEVYGK